jgi:uncharacterized protein involved in exopolysaccharide biosynthesis
MSDKKPPVERPAQAPNQCSGYPSTGSFQSDPVDWGAYWGVLVEERKLIGIVTAATTLVALLIAFLIPPVYRAEVLAAPAKQENVTGLGALVGQFGDLASLAGINLGPPKDRTDDYVAVLKSRALSVSFIKDQKLKPFLFPRKWDAEKNQWEGEAPTDWDAFKLWDKDIRRIDFDRKTGLVTLLIEWTDPVLAARWANELIKATNNRLRTEAVERADRSIAYLQIQLGQTESVEVQQAIYRLIEAQTKEKMVANTQEEYAFRVLDPAVPPQERASPKRLLIVVTGIVLGLALATLIASLRRTHAK